MNNILLHNEILYDKLKAHQEGIKHFAFSVFLFDKNNNLLIQKRAKNKYHSGGLWSNTCCSHFKNINEFNDKENTAKLRIKNELGIDYNNDLLYINYFEYKSKIGNLIENEIDYIFTGKIDDNINFYKKNINKNEVEDIKFINFDFLKKDIKKHNNNYTIWLKLILENDIIKEI